jgi:hypothetical protein
MRDVKSESVLGAFAFLALKPHLPGVRVREPGVVRYSSKIRGKAMLTTQSL